MNWNNWIRKTHRLLSIVFTVTVLTNFAIMAVGKASDSPLLPLALLLFSGLYLFVLPYTVRKGR